MEKNPLYSLIKDIETIAPKVETRDYDEEEKLSQRIELEPQIRRGGPGKRRRTKK